MTMDMQAREINLGTWLNPPTSSVLDGAQFKVVTQFESDFWRETSYGFIHESGHALLNDFPQESSVELSWLLNYDQQFDQAGLFIFADSKNWIKAGVEFADGAPQLGAVVTREKSDWSVAPVPEWMGKEIHLRASRSGDALTIRARCESEWKLVRLAPLDPDMEWKVGLHCASPTRAGLEVTFTSIKVGKADSRLH